MARKFDLISQLYVDTSKEVLSPDKWAAFLRTACYNYRLRFDEQLLIYAQKPEATAVLQIDRWNRTFGRWVNRGAKGIAVFERHDGVSQKLVHYFDISDTHAGEYSRAVPIWTMQPEYTDDVIATLESSFGDLEDKDSLAKAIMSAANNAVEDNTPDYIRDLLLSTNDTFLEDLGEDSVTAMYKELLTNSIAYMMMTRLGVDTEMYFDDDDFRNVVNFNSDDTLNALGVATGAIAEMGLSEVSKTVLALNRQNRTFVENRQPEYTNDRNNERSFEDGRTDLHNAGRLSASQSDASRTAEGRAGTVRSDEEEVSVSSAQNPLYQSADEGQADRTLGGNRTDSAGDGGTPAQTDGSSGGRDGEAESGRSDEVDTPDEQSPALSTGDRTSGTDLRLNPEEQAQNFEPVFSTADTIQLIGNVVDFFERYPHLYSELNLGTDRTQAFVRLSYTFNHAEDTERLFDKMKALIIPESASEDFERVYKQVEQRRNLLTVISSDKFVSGDTNFNIFDEDGELRKHPFFGVDEVVNEILATTPHLKASLDEIRGYFEGFSDIQKRTEYIRSIFNDDFTEIILADDTRVGYKTYENGLLIWKGRYPDREGQSFHRWDAVAGHFEAMRLLGMLHSVMKPLPSQDGQLQLITESAGRNNPAFSFSQELIDAALTRGSGVSEGKLRIYEQYQKSLSKSENIYFLKKEYGIGGSSSAVPYTGVGEDHSGKGIELRLGYDEGSPRQMLTWNYVEKRIGELIKLDRYLNSKEKEYYPRWLERQEELRAERAAEREIRESLFTPPSEKSEPKPVEFEYRYTLGASVYIGASEYEILSVDDDRVMLFDKNFPLFNKEMPRAEFDAKVKENPMNDHLKVAVQPEKEQETSQRDYSKYNPLMQEYFRLKDEHPDTIILYRIGEFLEAMGDNAELVSQALGLQLTRRMISSDEDIKMCGFPASRLETNLNMLLDRGHKVGISNIDENHSRKFYLMESDRAHEPIQSHPVGRIDYINANGEIENSIEYTNPTMLEKDIKEESTFGVKMAVYLYMDTDGNTMPHDFIDRLPTPLQHFEIIDQPQPQSEYDSLLKRATEILSEYTIREFGTDDFELPDDLSEINVAYTTTEDEKHELTANVNLVDFRIETKIDDTVVRTEQYDSLQDIVENGLDGMEFDDLIYVSDEELAPFYEEHDELDDVDPAVIRQQLEDAGIVNGELVDEDKLNSDPFIQQVMADVEAVADNSDLIGQKLTLDEHKFIVESVGGNGEVSMRDITFEGTNGFPIFRSEKVGFVRRAIEEQQTQQEEITPAWERQPRAKAQTFDLHPDIPMADRHTFDLKAFELEEVGKKARFRRNVEAIRVLKECEFDNSFATPEGQQVLAQYVGWGGIPEAFDENNTAWADEFTELYGLLSPEEYQSARESTLTAFYTPPVVISAIYKAMEQMGFKEGNILEPSCGIGNFIGMLPQSMENSRVYGVEIDKISAGIAQQLYQRSSIAGQPFEEANIPDSFFDAVVGNVPFGDFSVADKRYDKNHFLIHDYFFAKSLDKLRPGGVMALVTSKGTMDKENTAVRKYIAQRAELLGAIRLPNNTFKGNAGTEVVSDILILQKRDRIIDIEPDWVHLNTDENGIRMNSYFVEHPDMVLGDMKMVSGRFGEEATCVPYENADLAALLDEAVSNIHGEINEYEQDEELEKEDNSIPADPNVRNFSYTLLDDVIYFRENSRMSPVDMSATAENRIKGLIEIRNSVRHLLELQTEDYPDSDIKAEMQRLNTLYDEYTKKYGLISSRANNMAFSRDSSYSLLSSLEVLDEDGNLERKADIFFKRTVKAHKPVTSVDTATEALAVSMGEKAEVDMDYMCELTGKSEQEIYDELQGVIFLNPLYENNRYSEQKYLTADEYLSGNVREKLETAQKSAAVNPDTYSINVQALERVQPEPLTASEISVRLGATWIPPEIIRQFVFEFLGTPRYAQWKMQLHYSPYTSEWSIENKSYDNTNIKAYRTYGTDRINAYRIIEETLNLKDVRIFDYVEDEFGKRKPVLNKKETTIALQKQELIKEGFREWIWKDPQRRERLCKIYNEKFNSTRPREYDGSHITFSGMNPEIELREHQKNAVAHILYGGNTLLAHAVGAGKTFEMTAAAMESKRLGLCSKSLFVVPNHLTEQWAAEFLQLYPAANILVATKKDFETANRKRFCGRIATGDYDAIIIGHSQFEKIPMSIERQRALLEQQIDEITDGIAELKENRGDNFSIKQLEKTRKSIKVKLQKLNDQTRKDDVVTFEELGVDRLFIDESHYYKNLYLYTKMRNVGGIAQTEAQKSSDLFMKCRYLDEITGGRGTVFATGTPISNSMVELYTIQRYLQYETLVENGLQHFDAWASTFGETVTAYELKPEGTGYRTKTRFAKFYNLPELMAMFKQVADIKTADTLNLPTPTPHYHNVAVKPSEMQKTMVADLAERAEKVRGGNVDPSVDNMLKITNDGRKLALDQRMINPMLPDNEGSKINACVDNIFTIWQNNTEKKSAQLVFCDLSTPKLDAEFSVYTDIQQKLIERGVPESEIRFIHGAKTEVQKQELFKKVRKGEVRVLLGSTQKMGAGTNVQNKLIALHDIDCPWRPSDLEQRSGRIIRQGNENPDVEIYRYVTEETFDAYLYQLVEGKQKFAAQIMTSKSPVRTAEDIDDTALSYAEIKMLATGNPYIKEKMDLDIQVNKLKMLKSYYLSQKYDLEDKIIKFYPQEIALQTARIKGLKADLEIQKTHPKEIDGKFVGMTIQGTEYKDKAEAGKAIIEFCKTKTNADTEIFGEYRGFKMEIEFNQYERAYVVTLRENSSYHVTLGTDIHGNITRLDNAIDGIESRLNKAEEQLANTQAQLETAKVEVEKPFAQEDELQQKMARLTELNALLDMNQGDVPVVGGEPDEKDSQQIRDRNNREER
jgi:N12 class adenine-specific DNA methylase/predicted RNA methylase